MPNLIGQARTLLGLLKESRQEMGALGGSTLPGGSAGNGAELALGDIARDLKDVKRALEPSAADERSIL